MKRSIKVTLVRYGETDWTERDLHHGRLDSPLRKTGRRNAQMTARRLPLSRRITTLNNELDWEQTLFTFILHAGNSRSNCKQAAEFAQEGNWEEAQNALDAAVAEQLKAHEINTQIIRREAEGEELALSVLLVHAMDLLLLAWSEIDFTEQYIAMNKRVAALEKELAGLRDQHTKD